MMVSDKQGGWGCAGLACAGCVDNYCSGETGIAPHVGTSLLD